MEHMKVISENVLAFYRPWKSRVAAALFAVLHIVTYPIFWAIPGWQVPMTAALWYRYGIVEVMCLVIGAWVLYYAGPDNLIFDLSQRTYQYISGWPLRPQVHQGPWEDMAAVCVVIVSRGYCVGITWKDSKMRARFQGTIWGTFTGLGRLDRANQMAEEIATVLGLPVVEQSITKRSTGS